MECVRYDQVWTFGLGLNQRLDLIVLRWPFEDSRYVIISKLQVEMKLSFVQLSLRLLSWAEQQDHPVTYFQGGRTVSSSRSSDSEGKYGAHHRSLMWLRQTFLGQNTTQGCKLRRSLWSSQLETTLLNLRLLLMLLCLCWEMGFLLVGANSWF